jgi:acyl-CoA thioester hydrolase
LRKRVSLRPAGATVSTHRYRVPFFDTDAMGVVHHANYIRYLELARIVWLDEHDLPYRQVEEQGTHYATTRVELDYKYPARFDDRIDITVWLDWIRGASLCMAYEIDRDDTHIANGYTVHAVVNTEGRVRRFPKERLANLRPLAVRPAPNAP